MAQNVVSREYKVMLRKEKFVGSQDDLLKQAAKFWNAFKDSIKDIVFDTDGSLDKVEKQRTIRFYDTEDLRLRKNNYIFRERVDLKTKKRKVEAECALIAWYDKAGKKDRPVVVEFSFKYENDKEKYDGKVTQRAYDIFVALKDKLAKWIDSEGPTKTAYVYFRA